MGTPARKRQKVLLDSGAQAGAVNPPPVTEVIATTALLAYLVDVTAIQTS